MPAADGGDDSGASESPRAGRDAGKGGAGAGGAKADAGVPSDDTDAGASDLQSVTIRFSGKFGDRALTCGENYTLPALGDARVTPTEFRFFVQDVRLVTASGQEEPLIFDARAPVQTRDVALIDFTDEQGSCGIGYTARNTTITGKVPPGEYKGIVFVNGVPESINHQDVVTGTPPLADVTTHWGWTNGYRFIMSGIQVTPGEDADADGGSAPDAGTSFVHAGAGGCSGSTQGGFTCARPNRNRIALDGFDPAKNSIVADLAKIFAEVDLKKPVECHGPSSPACGPAYAALGLNAADGTARDTQHVFRVE